VVDRIESGSIVVAAGARDAWEVCVAYEELPEYIPGIASCRLDDDGVWHWTGRAFGMERAWRSRETERRDGEFVAWVTDDPMVPDGRVLVEPLDQSHARVTIELRYRTMTWRDRVLVNRAFARARLALDLRHYRRRVEQRARR
jgi:uncharacterized membrane protein